MALIFCGFGAAGRATRSRKITVELHYISIFRTSYELFELNDASNDRNVKQEADPRNSRRIALGIPNQSKLS